jgi:NAD(P)H-quinone oxidoreductase subunit I
LKLQQFGNGIAKGMAVTIKYLFRHPITTQYPEQKLSPSRRIRGNELIWDVDKCTGCATCARTCPIGAIEINTSIWTEQNKYKVDKIQIDTGYCIQCGLCVEACPYEALYMGRSYERAMYRREDVVQENRFLLASDKRQPSAYAHPELAKDIPEQTLLVNRASEDKHGS